MMINKNQSNYFCISFLISTFLTGKIPYFQCVLVGGKASQYPLRPLSPATTPAINPAMMRAMMEQRASVLEQKARPAGQ